jgi:hypothetical protein
MAMLAISGTARSAVAATAGRPAEVGTDIGGLVIFFGPVVAISLAGALAGIIITARTRALDVALTSINGAGPGSTWAATAIDGAIATGTALILAAVAAAMGEFAATASLRRHFGQADFSWPLAAWLVLGAAAVLGGAAAAMLPAVRTLLVPPFEVLSRFVAD